MVVIEGKWNENNYTIIEKIGEGTFGEILKVKNGKGNTVALKVSKNTSSITREYYIMDRLKSLNAVPRIYDYDDWKLDGSIYHFIAMDYIQGDNLKDYRKKNKLTLKIIFKIGLSIASFLEDVYRLGFKYTDIKMENILLDENGTMYFVDFGGVVEKNSSIVEFTPCYNMISWRNSKYNKYTENVIFSTTMILITLIFNREYSPIQYDLRDIILKVETSNLNFNAKKFLKNGLMGTYTSLRKYKFDLIKLSCNSQNVYRGFHKIDYFFVGSIIFFAFSIIYVIKVWFF